MINAPRFVRIHGVLHLMIAQYRDGELAKLAIVQCIGEEGQDKAEFLTELSTLTNRAANEHPIIEWEDLPETFRAQYEAPF